jgi:dimethylamine monooxygenase subunit A
VRLEDLPPVEVPFPVTSPHRVAPAPRPLRDAPHVLLDDAWPAAVARRLQRLRTDRAGVVVTAPRDDDRSGAGVVDGSGAEQAGLVAAVRAAWDLLPWRPGPAGVPVPLLGLEVDLAAGTCRRTGPSAVPEATEHLLGRTGLDLLVDGWLLACSDDLVVLHRRGPGELAAELLAVAFPSGWPVRARGGASLGELHGPVADGEVLRTATPALSEALLVKGPFVQHVWGLNPTGRLDRDPLAPDREPPSCPPPERWWLRVERQTTLPLPALGRALFCIRPYLQPLVALSPEQRGVLREAVASMSPEALAYKGIAEVRDDLVAWL